MNRTIFTALLAITLIASPALARMFAIETDDFNRATAFDLGANWASHQNGLEITNNAYVQTSTAGASTADYNSWSADDFGDDQYSQVEISTNAPISARYYAVGARMQGVHGSTTMTMYVCLMDSANLYTYKIVNNADTQLGSTDSVSPSVGDIFRIEVSGANPTSVVCKLDGSTIATESDSDIDTGGQPGIGLIVAPGLNMDNWEGGDLTGGATTVPPMNLPIRGGGYVRWIASFFR
jgi:hypothetical protein